jgi:hypothetical protein
VLSAVIVKFTVFRDMALYNYLSSSNGVSISYYTASNGT